MSGYKRQLLDTRPTEGDDAGYKVIVVVFTDLSADRAQGVFDEVLQQLAVPLYVEDGILFGPFYEGHEGTAIYNASFRPFSSPVPFLFVRQGVISDWKFFWTTRTGSTCGRTALENPESTLLLRNYAACRGARGATKPGFSDKDTVADAAARVLPCGARGVQEGEIRDG